METVDDHTLEILEERKKEHLDRRLLHSGGRCSCSQTRRYRYRDIQKAARRKERSYREVIRDLKE